MQKWPFKYGFIWSSACTIDALSAYLMHSYSCDRPGSCAGLYGGMCPGDTPCSMGYCGAAYVYRREPPSVTLISAQNERVLPGRGARSAV